MTLKRKVMELETKQARLDAEDLYRKFREMTVEQKAAHFGVTIEQYQAVVDKLRARYGDTEAERPIEGWGKP